MDLIKITDQTFKIKSKTGVVITNMEGPAFESITGELLKSFKGAGEYEVGGISVIGIKTEEGTVYIYEVDGLRICYLGNITKKLSDNKVSQIGDIDVLLVPVTSESVEMVQQIESYYIVPFASKNEEDLEKFLKETGYVVQRMNKFSLKKEELIEDSTAQIVVLTNK